MSARTVMMVRPCALSSFGRHTLFSEGFGMSFEATHQKSEKRLKEFVVLVLHRHQVRPTRHQAA